MNISRERTVTRNGLNSFFGIDFMNRVSRIGLVHPLKDSRYKTVEYAISDLLKLFQLRHRLEKIQEEHSNRDPWEWVNITSIHGLVSPEERKAIEARQWFIKLNESLGARERSLLTYEFDHHTREMGTGKRKEEGR